MRPWGAAGDRWRATVSAWLRVHSIPGMVSSGMKAGRKLMARLRVIPAELI